MLHNIKLRENIFSLERAIPVKTIILYSVSDTYEVHSIFLPLLSTPHSRS